MAIGPGIYKAQYENCSLEELEKKIKELEKFLLSDELKEMRQEEIDKGVDDNNCITNVETEIEVLKELIANKQINDNNTVVEKCMCGNELKINWASDEKFKMVRCSNCNAEMKFRNPNLIEEKLDDIINKVVNDDPFWGTTIKKYFDSLTTKNENDKINFLKKIVKNKDLFNEFTKELVKNENSKNLYEKYIKTLDDKQKNLSYEFYKKNENDKIWWVDNRDKVGEHLFSFNKETIFNLFKDYPYKLTEAEKEIFDNENPYWADFFKDRSIVKTNVPICPNCNERLSKLMPDGKVFSCNKCGKCYKNDDGNVGEETSSPYTRNDALY